MERVSGGSFLKFYFLAMAIDPNQHDPQCKPNWSVALIAVAGGQSLMRFVNVVVLQRCMAVALLVLSVLAAVSAIRG